MHNKAIYRRAQRATVLCVCITLSPVTCNMIEPMSICNVGYGDMRYINQSLAGSPSHRPAYEWPTHAGIAVHGNQITLTLYLSLVRASSWSRRISILSSGVPLPIPERLVWLLKLKLCIVVGSTGAAWRDTLVGKTNIFYKDL